MTIHDFTYTGGDSGAPYQAQQYDRLDRAVTQVQYYFDSVRDWRQDVVNYATQARQDRDHIQTLGDTIVSTGEHIDTMVQVSVDAADTATTAASHTATDRQAAQDARTGAETAETNAQGYATASASSASSAADILTATEALGVTVDNSVGTRVFVGDVMIFGDTGWRDISDSMSYGWEGKLHGRRVGDLVELRFSEMDATHATSPTCVKAMPLAFRTADGNILGPTAGNPIGDTSSNGVLVSSGSQNQIWRFPQTDSEGSAAGSAIYQTNRGWPTSLPGISA